MSSRLFLIVILLLVCSANAVAQNETTILRPKEIDDVLVNPGMGIETFQRFNGDAINPGLGWSEEGPVGKLAPASRASWISPPLRFPIAAGFGRRSSRSRGKYAGRFSMKRCGKRTRIIKRWRFG